MRKQILNVSFLAVSAIASGQGLSYDFYGFRNGNMFNVNPAYCSKDEGINVIMNAQSQNPGVSYANKNFMAGAYSRIGANQGLGAKLISDTRGAFQILKADVSYSYVARFTGGHKLSMGLAGGVFNSNMSRNRIDNYEMLDQTDPTLTDNQFNTTQFTAGAGALYSFKDIDVSVSAPHIITTSHPIISYMNAAVFYTKKINEKFKVQPWLCYQNIPVTKNVTALLVKGTYKDMAWLQVGYQTNKSFMASFGAMIENIGLSYGFKLSNSDLKQIATGIHEVQLSVRIDPRGSKKDQKTGLENVLASLDRLLGKTITPETKAEIRAELEKLKLQLQNLETNNSDPAQAKKIEAQLLDIDQKVKVLEKRLLDE